MKHYSSRIPRWLRIRALMRKRVAARTALCNLARHTKRLRQERDEARAEIARGSDERMAALRPFPPVVRGRSVLPLRLSAGMHDDCNRLLRMARRLWVELRTSPTDVGVGVWLAACDLRWCLEQITVGDPADAGVEGPPRPAIRWHAGPEPTALLEEAPAPALEKPSL